MSAPASTNYHPPVKRSMTIAGHQTSISLEPIFWHALEDAAAVRNIPINALVAQIDRGRLALRAPAGLTPNLTSAVRQWLYAELLALGE